MILHRQLKALLHRLGLDEETPPAEDHWLALLVLLNDRFRQFEEDRHRLQRSLEIHSREVQALYKELTQERDKVSSTLAAVDAALILMDAQGKPLLISAEGENRIGYAEHELEGKEILPLLGLDHILPKGGLAQLLQGLRPVEMTVALHTREGIESTRIQLQPLIRERQLIGCLMQIFPQVLTDIADEVTQEELACVPTTHPSPATHPLPSTPRQQESALKILLVESDPKSVQSLLHNLADHEVQHFSDANEALEAYKKEYFDAILCCQHPTGCSGIELCKRLRQDTQNGYPYFILMTPPEARQNATAALQAGVDAFLNKPLEPVELQVRLKVARGVQQRLKQAHSSLMSLHTDRPD